MDARAYRPEDREGCLAVFDSNGLAERPAFETFLEQPGSYFVLDFQGRIVACGGFEQRDDEWRLVWGMVHRELQRKGLGRFLLLYRLKELSKLGAATVRVEVAREVAPFFEGQGFRRLEVSEDRVALLKKLAVCV